MSIEALRRGLKVNGCIGLAGKSHDGKNYQINKVFDLAFTTDTGEVIHPFRKMLYVAVGMDRSSSAGTSGEVLDHPMCDLETPETVEDAIGVLDRYSQSTDYSAIVVDSFSSFRRMAVSEIRRRAISDNTDAKSLRGKAKKQTAFNDRDLNALANGDCLDFISRLGSMCPDRPVLKIWTCHTKDHFKTLEHGDQGPYIGQKPEASFTQWTALYSMAQVVWHLSKVVPEIRGGVSPEEINKLYKEGGFRPRYYAHTIPTVDHGGLGELMHIKRQKDGHMAIFDEAPPIWENPDLGQALTWLLASQHNLTFNDDGHIITT